MQEEIKKFDDRLAAIKGKLPRVYCPIITHKYPTIKYSDIYNVIHRGTRNEKILMAMEDLFN